MDNTPDTTLTILVEDSSDLIFIDQITLVNVDFGRFVTGTLRQL
jgi:hypothetical protein